VFVRYDIKTDEEIALEAKDGDNTALEFLINKYRNFVKAKARSYFLIGADREDIIQEGMIGFTRPYGILRGTSSRLSGLLPSCALPGRS
jgi:RNA polymerase sporulation-specific sigma factor